MESWIAAAERNNIKRSTFRERINAGWSLEEAATTPLWTRIKKRERKHEKWLQVAERNGISDGTFRQRVNQYGWSPEKAATEPIATRREDNDWLKVAQENGIKNHTFYNRVDELLWSPKEAATTPAMTRKEISDIGNNAQAEYREIINERIFNDENNLFKLTPHHLEIAKKNGLNKYTVLSRVKYYGWTVQEAITMPTMKPKAPMPEGYSRYREIAKKNGINESTYRERVKRGWSLKKASTKKPSLSNPSRVDIEWIKLAEKNGIKRGTYDSRIKMGWDKKDAATVKPLKKGKYLNEKTKENARKAFKKFGKR